MRGDRAAADEELRADFPIRQALADERQHLPLALGEVERHRGSREGSGAGALQLRHRHA